MTLKINLFDGSHWLKIETNEQGVVSVSSNLHLIRATNEPKGYAGKPEDWSQDDITRYNGSIDGLEATVMAVAALNSLTEDQLSDVVATAYDSIINQFYF